MEEINKKAHDEARRHIEQQALQIPDIPRNIWVVHPCCKENWTTKRPEKIKNLLEALKNSEGNYRRILLADPHHYLINEHRLVEGGLFDYVIQTRVDQGIPLDWDELSKFKHSQENLIGGCYRNRCVMTFKKILKSLKFEDVEVVGAWTYGYTASEYMYEVFYNFLHHSLRTHLPIPINMPAYSSKTSK